MEAKKDKNRNKKGQWVEGNKIREKYDLEKTKRLLKKSLKMLKNDETIYSVVQLAARMGLYYKWYYMRAKIFNEDPEVYEYNEQIHTIAESRMFERSCTGEINPFLGQFGLKAYHRRNDKPEEASEPQRLDITLSKKQITGTVNDDDE